VEFAAKSCNILHWRQLVKFLVNMPSLASRINSYVGDVDSLID